MGSADHEDVAFLSHSAVFATSEVAGSYHHTAHRGSGAYQHQYRAVRLAEYSCNIRVVVFMTSIPKWCVWRPTAHIVVHRARHVHCEPDRLLSVRFGTHVDSVSFSRVSSCFGFHVSPDTAVLVVTRPGDGENTVTETEHLMSGTILRLAFGVFDSLGWVRFYIGEACVNTETHQ